MNYFTLPIPTYVYVCWYEFAYANYLNWYHLCLSLLYQSLFMIIVINLRSFVFFLSVVMVVRAELWAHVWLSFAYAALNSALHFSYVCMRWFFTLFPYENDAETVERLYTLLVQSVAGVFCSLFFFRSSLHHNGSQKRLLAFFRHFAFANFFVHCFVHLYPFFSYVFLFLSFRDAFYAYANLIIT